MYPITSAGRCSPRGCLGITAVLLRVLRKHRYEPLDLSPSNISPVLAYRHRS
jgi:hypothetical protein